MVDPAIVQGVKSAVEEYGFTRGYGSDLKTYRPLIAWFDDRFMEAFERLAAKIEKWEADKPTSDGPKLS